ncbi:ABC transporter permease [Subtercola frigoramans]|uniref:ABC-type antimicrobial peptide transport system permease subunit n=1 Tax=Subtercola frigoramans TaxID=120298 RepID=A0ABS2L5W2_9MICO|nr:ABC transporter permease [Subtercola frigoramans]MBM7472457.1 ABC-type antimicrobial peptide transport system permease subunit [Subtercola frigoramans]
MFGTYLRRELVNRRKQTIIISIGMALAIGLVILVNSISAGVQGAQATVLQSVYGVGTDITISQAAAAPTAGTNPGGQFNFGSGSGATSDGTTTLNQSTLTVSRTQTVFADTALATVQSTSGVSAATATLALTNQTFSGQLPDQSATGTTGGQGGAPAAGDTPPTGGPDGAGGSAFDVNSFTVLGLDPSGSSVGPLSAVSLATGRLLTAADVGTDNAVLDSSYATSASLATGGTIDIGGTTFTIVGTVSSTGSDSVTASNVYIPLDVAQTLSSNAGMISNIYVTAASSGSVDSVAAALQTALPAATVSTQADLASTVSGSLSTASSLLSNLGTWLSVLVLAAAFLIAILFTISGVTRRTREFGTLKAVGWSNCRIVSQVAGESVVQGLIGGAIGIVVGLVGIVIVNIIAPTLSGSAASTTAAAGGPGGGGPGGGGFGAAASTAATTTVTLQAPVTIGIILIAVGLAVLGGLLAGAIGGWRAARLRPAEALRSVG